MELPSSTSKQKDPPTRASSQRTATLIPLGLNQCSNAPGVIQARNTRWREAVNVRRSTRVVLLRGAGGIITILLLFRCRQQVGVQGVQLGFPELPVVFKPGGCLSQGTGSEAKPVRSSVLAVQDQISVFQHA